MVSKVGISQIGIAVPKHFISIEELAKKRKIPSAYTGKGLGVIEASTSIYPGTKGRGIVYLNLPEQFGIYGEKGSVEIEESKRVKLWEFEDGVQTSETIDPEIKGKVPVTSHYEELKQIVNAIREDGNVPVDGEEARKSLEVIRAIYYSSFTGKQVELPFSHDQDAELDQLIERSIRHES